MSDAGVVGTSSADNNSGAVYTVVPRMFKSGGEGRSRGYIGVETAKSERYGWSDDVRSMLCGLMSLCSMPALCRNSIADNKVDSQDFQSSRPTTGDDVPD